MTLLFSSVFSWAAADCPLDSILTFDIDSVLTEVTVFTYDDAGHTISEVVWTVNDGSRVGKSKKEDRYEGNTQVMTSTYVWDNTTSKWEGVAKTEYEYTNGKNTAITVFDWPTNTWAAKSKETYAYDADGREIEYYNYIRNSSSQLSLSQGRFHDYNPNGKLILEIIYTAHDGTTWSAGSKKVYKYDASNRQTLVEYYSSYSNGTWNGSTREVYDYDAAGNKTLEEKYSGMTGDVWNGSSKYTAEFNANKKEIEHITYTWVTTSKTWKNNKRTTKEYDGNNVTDEASYTWSNKWVGQTRTSKTYSGTLVTSEIEWKWSSNRWEHNKKTETQYTGSNISTQTKSVWKNSGWVNVSQLTNTYVSNHLTEANTKAWRNGAWQDSLRTVNTYDAKNINTLSVTAVYKGSEWMSTDSTTREVTYTTIGSKDYVLEDVSMKWTAASNKWTGVKRETKEYDTSGNVTQWDTYTYVSEKGWVHNARHHYAYKDGNKNLETLNDYLTWNQTTNSWVGISRTEKGYDATNRQVKTSTYSWNTSHNDWEGLSSSEDVYDNGIKVTSYSYKWDYTDWQWIGMFKHDYTYSGNNVIEQIDWRYNKTTDWYRSTRVTYTFDNKGRKVQTINYKWDAANNQWCMTSTDQTTYDSDADGGRLREQLKATGSNCAVTTYALQHYMYGCDPRYYTIRFVNEDGSELSRDTLEYGATPTHDDPIKESTAQYTYTFTGWTPAIQPVTGDATYTATFSSTVNTYTITWLNDDGSELSHETLEYGATPTHDAPVKESTAQYTYTFAGWTPAIQPVTGNATYTASFSSTVNTYTITWLNEDGSELSHETLEYGAFPSHDDPIKESTAEYTYTFTGWDPEVSAVTKDATYTATFDSVKNTYTITWLNDDGSELSRETLEYGAEPIYHGAEPTKEPDGQYIYTFEGWTPDVEPVTGDATYTATFTTISCGDYPLLPVVDLYDWLLMLDVRSARAMGYVFSEEDVTWYRVQGEPDKLSDGAAADDVRVGTGYSFTLNESLANTGDYYAMVDVSSSSTGVPCTGMVRSNMIHCTASSGMSTPVLAPTLVQPGEPQQVIGLNPDASTIMDVYDISGRLLRTVFGEGVDRLDVKAETVPGCYQVIVQNGNQRAILRYMVVQ